MGNKKAAKPGDALLDLYSADWYNFVNRTLRMINTPKSPNMAAYKNAVEINVIGNITKEQFEAVNLDGPYFDETGANIDTTEMYSSVDCQVTGTLEADTWVILQAPLTPDQPSRAVVLGMTWAKFDLVDTDHTRVTVDAGELKSSTSGRGIIIRPPEDVGVGYGLILITGESSPATILSGLINTTFSGTPTTFTVKTFYALVGSAPSGSTITVSNKFGWEAASEDAEVVVIWDPENSVWIPLQMECPS